MDVAITGGSGFVGRAMVDSIIAAGHRCRVLSRSGCRIGDEVVRGALLDDRAISDLVRSADVVVHGAGLVRTSDEHALHRVNTDATAHLVDAAGAAGVNRLVLVSSGGVYGRPGVRVDERTEPRPVTPYERSKVAAEHVAAAHYEGELRIIRPTNVIGAQHPMRPLRRFLDHVRTGRLVIGADARTNYVSVRAVGELIAQIVALPEAPRLLNACEPKPLVDFITIVGEVLGVEPAWLEIPSPVSRPAEAILRWGSGVDLLQRPLALFDRTEVHSIHHLPTSWSVRDEIRDMAEHYGSGGG